MKAKFTFNLNANKPSPLIFQPSLFLNYGQFLFPSSGSPMTRDFS
jgi:hypothetical protein